MFSECESKFLANKPDQMFSSNHFLSILTHNKHTISIHNLKKRVIDKQAQVKKTVKK